MASSLSWINALDSGQGGDGFALIWIMAANGRPSPAAVMERTMSKAQAGAESRFVRVWDPFVRFAHWTIAIAFFIAYFTEGELLTLHVWAGYAIGVLVALRATWGVIGPKRARFTDFVYRPDKAFIYLSELATFRAKRYLGHSPAGGAMVIALLIGLMATVWSGLELYAAEEQAGPLAAVATESAAAQPRSPMIRASGREKDEEREGEGNEFWEEVHETISNLMLVLVVLHVGGVVLASVVHRENLVRAMVTGLKRAEDR